MVASGPTLILSALVREVAEDADFEARSQNRSVQVVSNDNCSIKGVEELLRSAVENVVRNAVRYTPRERRLKSPFANRTAAVITSL